MTWIDDLLIALSTYPMDYNTWFAQGDTIAAGRPIDQRESKYTGILLAPPGPLDPPEIGLISGLPDDVSVCQAVGLLPEEVRWAEQHGGQLLWDRIAQYGEPVLDRGRESVVQREQGL